jgi:NAD+ synthetase
MRVALGQLNTTIGDFAGNLTRIRALVARARAERADILVLPELALCGYPPLDLLDRISFIRDQQSALTELAADARDIAIVTGAIVDAPAGSLRPICNAAVALVDGEIAHVQPKTLLPTYDVFDEARYFEPARERSVWTYRGVRIGLAICEDLWTGEFWGDLSAYSVDPVADLVASGVDLLLGVSASPWEQHKIELREKMLSHACAQHRVPLLFVNLVGGNDELVFDGASCGFGADGRSIARLARFEEDFAVVEPLSDLGDSGREAVAVESDVELLERALVLGIRDYLHKLGLAKAVIAVSGGIDSAVTADLAARALGPENVSAIMMPGPFSSEHSVSDARELAENLGIEARLVSIESIYKSFIEQFQGLFGASENYGLTQENLQARIRGTLLMACSNYEDRIVLATGNKSELSVGYTTLYGDLVGGLAVIGDVLKRDVYRLAEYANRAGPRVPVNTIRKPPSAELAPDQLDSDSLPEYDVLDRILEAAVERRQPGEAIARSESPGPDGVDHSDNVTWVLRALDRNEYKRRQAPLILRVSPKAFGTGRRVPIVHRSGWGL